MLRDIINLLKKDDLQSQALAECHEMLGMCEEMVPTCVETLRRQDDASLDIDILTMDKKLNAFERDVRRKVMTHLSLGNNADLTAGLVLISIVIDIERIGDYSKNIYDLAQIHPARLDGGPLEDELQQLERESLDILSKASRSFREGRVRRLHWQ